MPSVITSPPITDLGKAFAAIIATLVAALAEHARRHPSLAGLIALAIGRLEAMSADFAAIFADWRNGRTAARPRPARAARARTPSPTSQEPRHPDSAPQPATWRPDAPRAPP